MSRTVLVPVATGSEELELISIVDVLRRAGARVTIASCEPDGSRNIITTGSVRIEADSHISECVNNKYNLIALPGGAKGAETLRDCASLITMLQQQQAAQQWYAAICAAPAVVLASHGLLDNVQATGYPSFMEQMEGAQVRADVAVVVDEKNRVVTSQGPATALAFALKLVEVLYGKDAHRPIASAMLAS